MAISGMCNLRQTILAAAVMLAAGVMPAAAKTTLTIVRGSGDFQTFEPSITIDSAQDVILQWTTDEVLAKNGGWRITNNKTLAAATGDAGAAPAPGHFARFVIPGSNFTMNATYSITVVARSAANAPIGNPSPAVTVTREAASPPPVINFGSGAKFPDVELIEYAEHKLNASPYTQAKVTIRLRNNLSGPTDPIRISVSDFNVLMREDSIGVDVAALLHKGDTVEKTLTMNAVLPSTANPLTQWQALYDSLCGVDLRVAIDWHGTPAGSGPMNDHRIVDLYQGYGDSRPWDENKPAPQDLVCDQTKCVSLKRVARNICTALRGKVVGYSFFIGNKANAKFGAYGLARMPADPPPQDFTPTTKMQLASASKVLTGLATIALLQGQVDTPIANYLPKSWQTALPATHLTRAITFRKLVSQKSGVMQYYAAASGGQTYANLMSFFTQTLANPGAPYYCPGPPRLPDPTVSGDTGVPQVLPNPIISNQTACYTDTNFGLMRIILPLFKGGVMNDQDPLELGNDYVKIVQDKVLKPVGVTAACSGPAGNTALPYTLTPGKPGWDWKDTTLTCGDWGWFLSVDDYARVLHSLNSGDGKIITPCQFNDMEFNPVLGPGGGVAADHSVAWDRRLAGSDRWLEKNGGEGWDIGSAGGVQTTSVGIFGGASACTGTAVPGIEAVLFINSPVAMPPPPPGVTPPNPPGADQILLTAIQGAVTPKP